MTCNLYWWAMSQKVLAASYKWIENTSWLRKDFKENYNDDSGEGYFLEVDFYHFEKLYNLHHDLPFLPENMLIQKVEKLEPNLHDKKRIFHTHKKFKTSVKSWISTEKWFQKRFFQADE